MHKVDQLRQQHPRFVYHRYAYELKNDDLYLGWHFSIEPNLEFHPQIVIHHVNLERWQWLVEHNRALIDNLIFHLGLMEIPSYWKATCSPTIVIEAGPLTADQTLWWQDLLLKGQGEFFYLNQIDFTSPDFIHLTATDSSEPVMESTVDLISTTTTMIPLGGGKDSIVTLELMKQQLSDQELRLFALNPTQAVHDIANLNPSLPLILATRTIDPHLLQLNQQGYLNGHTPFSAYLAFLTTMVAVVFDMAAIAVSNESSANEANTMYLGHNINHQYSKSFEFEEKFRNYSKHYLCNNPKFPQYYSFLRPLHELQIAKRFVELGQPYFPLFRSCNRGQKTNTWCHECPKCLFAFLMLFPFVDIEVLTTQIFHSNLFDNSNLTQTGLQLVQADLTKPFECVGSREESMVAFYLSVKKYRQLNQPLPIVLQTINDQVLTAQTNLDDRVETILSGWNDQHYVPAQFLSLLQPKKNIYKPLTFDELNSQSILILGLGREGLSTYQFLRQHFADKKLVLADEKPFEQLDQIWQNIKIQDQQIEFHQLSESSNEALAVDVVFKTAGIPSIRLSQLGVSTQRVSSNTQLFFDLVKDKPITTIGVTGTKGKSTTTSVIYHVLKENDLSAIMGGNIGKPPLNIFAELAEVSFSHSTPIIVLELSSHQLAELQLSPHIAVIQAITPEHLDYYHSFEQYWQTKANITVHQSSDDLLIFNADSPITTQIAQQSQAQKISFSLTEQDTLPLTSDQIPLVGQFNLYNIMPAVKVGQKLGLSDEQISKAISTFKPLPHRLELVSEKNSVKYYNDSLATTPEATIRALEAFAHQPIILIVGGFNRGLNFQPLIEIIKQSSVKKIIYFPETGNIIATGLGGTDIVCESATSMDEAVQQAYNVAVPGDVVLMSPASASFNMFKDYAERGEQFKTAVQRLP